MSDANDLLMSGGTPWASFPSPGTVVEGTIIETGTRQARDIDTGDLRTWNDGSPLMEVTITLATDLRDDEIEDDDGTRLLVLNSAAKKNAVKAAVRKSGAKGLAVGDYLAVTYVKDGPKVAGKPFRAKEYEAVYAIGLGGTVVEDEPSTDEPPF